MIIFVVLSTALYRSHQHQTLCTQHAMITSTFACGQKHEHQTIQRQLQHCNMSNPCRQPCADHCHWARLNPTAMAGPFWF